MLHRTFQLEPDRVKYARSSTVYREQLIEWSDELGQYWGYMNNQNNESNKNYNYYSEYQPPKDNQQSQHNVQREKGKGNDSDGGKDGDKNRKDNNSPKSVGQAPTTNQFKVQEEQANDDFRFYELVLKLEKLYLEMSRNLLFEMPKICHPILLSAYFQGITLTRLNLNNISESIYQGITSIQERRNFLESDSYFKQYIMKQIGIQETTIPQELLLMFANELYNILQHGSQQEIEKKLADSDFKSYQLIMLIQWNFIHKLITKDRTDPQVAEYLSFFPFQKLGSNVLVAQLKLICNHNDVVIRIPLFGEIPFFDFKCIPLETQAQVLKDKIGAPQQFVWNQHSETALIGQLHYDVFINLGEKHIVKSILKSIDKKNIYRINRFELEIASMREVCDNCKSLLYLNNIQYTSQLQEELKQVLPHFQVNKDLPLYKRAMFMQFGYAEEGKCATPQNDQEGFPIFRQDSMPIGLFSKYMFKHRYLKKDYLDAYSGDLKKEMGLIEMTHTYYLSASNSQVERTEEELLTRLTEIVSKKNAKNQQLLEEQRQQSQLEGANQDQLIEQHQVQVDNQQNMNTIQQSQPQKQTIDSQVKASDASNKPTTDQKNNRQSQQNTLKQKQNRQSQSHSETYSEGSHRSSFKSKSSGTRIEAEILNFRIKKLITLIKNQNQVAKPVRTYWNQL